MPTSPFDRSRWPVLCSTLGLALLLGACASQTPQTPQNPAAAAAPPAAAVTPLPVDAALRAQAQAEVAPYLKTLESLVAIESGSRDLEGLSKLSGVIAGRLRQAGMQVELKPTRAPDFHPQLKGAELGQMVYATKAGKGAKKVLLIAHMDTVYARGMAAKQPFRIDGDRAYGLGIADDKQGVALILHLVDLLARNGFSDYAQLGVLINGDEEVGSPGSGAFLTQLGSEYDAVFSFEGGGSATADGRDMVRLATSSIAIVEMKVTGKASHAGSAPHLGRNALYELSHQMLKSRQFGDPAKGLQINWTVANAGGSRNVIPAEATAIADVRSLTNADLDLMEAALKKSIEEKLIPDTRIDLSSYRSRPAFVSNAASRALAEHARSTYAGLNLPMDVRERATGGGTDAAFAGLRPKGGVLESFGLRGFGAHSNDDEYVLVSNIAPRLYLATRMVMDTGRGQVRW
ncbi:glutamate carboxypeptidase [Xenophilus arseniciresistens]|uniref:Glutamate carboxypeptidase n=1 Tax=Xenophilus arseniciresistens TaxID=1283306 RepID=A0AAE3T0P0_9BURK|nr:glutamate carboxypeptidase [Xenophilus arseniciresistens]MDA7418412.1 glutamate carboxypeptidase [Xenophilus arseniciresistens]